MRHKCLLDKLKTFGIEGALLKHYLTDSLLVALHSQKFTKYPIRAVIPLGSILGPIIWYIYVNDVLDTVP